MKIRILYLLLGVAIGAAALTWLMPHSKSLIETALTNPDSVLGVKEVVNIKEINNIVELAESKGFTQVDISQTSAPGCQEPLLLVDTKTNNRLAMCQVNEDSVIFGFINGAMISASQSL